MSWYDTTDQSERDRLVCDLMKMTPEGLRDYMKRWSADIPLIKAQEKAARAARRDCQLRIHLAGTVLKAKQGATRYACPACGREIGDQGRDHSEACTFSEEI